LKFLKTIFIFGLSFWLLGAGLTFEKQKIKVGAVEISVEVARTQAQLSRGLMDRTEMPESSGMLFIFPNEETRHFWMKDTFIPLSIGFFNKNQILVDIQDMLPVNSVLQVTIPQYQSRKPAQFALEVNKGWFQRHKLKLGAKLHLPTPTKVQAQPKTSSRK
jgi:uncharacterized membrane protein (UPF0127 family)